MKKTNEVVTTLVSTRVGGFCQTMAGILILPRGDIFITNVCRVRKESGKVRFPMRLDRVPGKVRALNPVPAVMHIVHTATGMNLFQITAVGKQPVDGEWTSACPDIHPWTFKGHLQDLSEITGMDVRANEQQLWRDYRELSLGQFLKMYEDASMLFDAFMESQGSMELELETVTEDAPVHVGEMRLEKARPVKGRANQHHPLNELEAQVAGII